MIRHEVYWYKGAKPDMQPLASDIQADILIIGGGISGLMTAYTLAKAGRTNIILVEKSFIGGGATGKSSGFITPDSELEFSDLVTRFGVDEAKKLWAFANNGVSLIEQSIHENALSCDYVVQDSLFIANTEKKFKLIEEECGLLNEHYGGSDLYDKEKIKTLIGSDTYAGGVRYAGTFGINGFEYAQGLKKALQHMGVKIYEGTHIQSVHDHRAITKDGYHIEAEHIVVTIDRFLPELGIFPKETYQAQTFLTISKPLSDAQVASLFPQGKLMVWDSDLIYQYFRITGDNRLLFGAASMLYTYLPFEHAKGSNRILKKIQSYIQKKFSHLPEPIDIEYFWPGLIGVSKDFLPICGSTKSGLYYISGVAGLPWGAACGHYIAEKILAGRKDLDHFFDAHRTFPVGRKLGTVLTKPLAFALSHGIVKYFHK